MRVAIALLVAGLAVGCVGRASAAEVAVPGACSAEVNRRLADLIWRSERAEVDNVMVCGTTISASRTQRGGPHGDHQLLPLRVFLPGIGTKLVEVVTNDALDGVVTAPAGTPVVAYGQYFPVTRRFAAGIHDVHCATHRGADNGWVVVGAQRYPQRTCPIRR